MNDFINTSTRELEVCCGSLESVFEAVAGGAHRIELCSALSLDGLTPSLGLFQVLRSSIPNLRIHVLIRPREGDFVYNSAELKVMLRDIEKFVDDGADAVVAGALTMGGRINVEATRQLRAAAGDVPFTFHRAFDVVADQGMALEQLIDLGITRVLTSGGEPTAQQGIPRLKSLVAKADGRISILPGGGVNRHNARLILDETGAHEIHGSCSLMLPSGIKKTTAEEVAAVLASIG